ncbi:BON domain-containing protein [Chryseolinea serpens]|uniref:BON domain-containing protein n=1 Tax=Chryseolinea serpens TaxID=947013 RepID=UPI000933A8DB|nr:BON domain-containing protein [Chryseolinea serpens]
MIIRDEFFIDELEKREIEIALRLNSCIDERAIHVTVFAGVVVLRGVVRSSHEKDQAGRIAWSTPGVFNVLNNLTV